MVVILCNIWVKPPMEQVLQGVEELDVRQTDALEPSVEPTVNLRTDEVDLFEADDGRLFVQTPEMNEETLAEVMPTTEGLVAEVVVGVEAELTQVQPAERHEEPSVDRQEGTVTYVD